MGLLVGLGNPGEEYARQRHNIGFMAIDEIIRNHGVGAWKSKFQGHLHEAVVGGHRFICLKPQTYMNCSGDSVGAVARFFKIPVEEVIVFHDDLDIAAGKAKIKTGGGHGGHNGLRSIDAALTPQYKRIRLGIGHPGKKELVTGYVLHDFSKSDQVWLAPLIGAIATHLPLLLDGKDALYLNKLMEASGVL